ncbi:hypothetical protein EK21DRAFT_88531 [Setomelanomma holmii]|uniref:Uncharacterized protein n=1 Tax=Setomelanomma holmii TaxID=210430 RepID=A0A9P4HBG9_9PLEO|nr:hypothetical protein EK21DRAFT_88531 [Setomelanomma holmii]
MAPLSKLRGRVKLRAGFKRVLTWLRRPFRRWSRRQYQAVRHFRRKAEVEENPRDPTDLHTQHIPQPSEVLVQNRPAPPTPRRQQRPPSWIDVELNHHGCPVDTCHSHHASDHQIRSHLGSYVRSRDCFPNHGRPHRDYPARGAPRKTLISEIEDQNRLRPDSYVRSRGPSPDDNRPRTGYPARSAPRTTSVQGIEAWEDIRSARSRQASGAMMEIPMLRSRQSSRDRRTRSRESSPTRQARSRQSSRTRHARSRQSSRVRQPGSRCNSFESRFAQYPQQPHYTQEHHYPQQPQYLHQTHYSQQPLYFEQSHYHQQPQFRQQPQFCQQPQFYQEPQHQQQLQLQYPNPPQNPIQPRYGPHDPHTWTEQPAYGRLRPSNPVTFLQEQGSSWDAQSVQYGSVPGQTLRRRHAHSQLNAHTRREMLVTANGDMLAHNQVIFETIQHVSAQYPGMAQQESPNSDEPDECISRIQQQRGDTGVGDIEELGIPTGATGDMSPRTTTALLRKCCGPKRGADKVPCFTTISHRQFSHLPYGILVVASFSRLIVSSSMAFVTLKGLFKRRQSGSAPVNSTGCQCPSEGPEFQHVHSPNSWQSCGTKTTVAEDANDANWIECLPHTIIASDLGVKSHDYRLALSHFLSEDPSIAVFSVSQDSAVPSTWRDDPSSRPWPSNSSWSLRKAFHQLRYPCNVCVISGFHWQYDVPSRAIRYWSAPDGLLLLDWCDMVHEYPTKKSTKSKRQNKDQMKETVKESSRLERNVLVNPPRAHWASYGNWDIRPPTPANVGLLAITKGAASIEDWD